MNHRWFELGLFVVLAAGIGPALGGADLSNSAPQSQPHDATPPGRQPTAAEVPAAQLAELDRFRRIIENTEDSMGTRRGQAEALLRTRLSAATEMAAELLTGASDPSTRVAMCEAIAALGGKDPALLGEHHRALVEPLLGLLGGSAGGVSAKAAAALAAFPDGNVARRLGELARDGNAPLDHRLAAVDALALNIYERDVVRQLIRLLDTENGECQARVLDALRSAARQDPGNDIEKWKAWWQHEEETLSDAEWARNRARLYYLRLAESQREIEQLRDESRRRYDALAGRIADSLREVYRLTPQPAQRNEALLRWLSDPILEYRLGAATLIREEIEDGNLPSEAVVEALIAELNNRSPEMRRAVVGIVGALSVPANADAVLTLLGDERDVSVRQTALRVLGQLRNPTAIPTLIAELGNPSAPSGCVAEAANALRILGAKGRVDPALIAPAVPVLKERFAATPASDTRLRESLLRAMASLGVPEFREEFLGALGSDQPQVLVDAIQGLLTLGDTSGFDRLLTLTGHGDARVREVAVEAVGVLGNEPAHLELLMGRLSPPAEPAESVRNAAWDALRAILRRKPPAARLQWAERFRETPERQAAYLDELIKELAANNPPPPELNAARRRLAALCTERGDPAAALPIWQQLYAALDAANDPQAAEIGITLLTVGLDAGRHDVVKDAMLKLASAPASVKERTVKQVKDHIEAHRTGEQTDRLLALLDVLLSLPAEAYGDEFGTYLLGVKQALTAPPPATAPAHTPG